MSAWDYVSRNEFLLEVCHGAFSGKELKDKPVKPRVTSWLSFAQQELLDQHAPERLALATNRTAKSAYESGGSPHIALRIQELYDVTATHRLAMGRVPGLVHILVPNMRRVQITQEDPAGFWREHYPRVKQKLQRRYPKHTWR